MGLKHLGVGLGVVAVGAALLGSRRSELRAALDVEWLCARDLVRFTRRHRRYGVVAVALVAASLPAWRRRRVLRTGFCFLQHVDDLLDGDRPTEREPLDVVEAVVDAIERRSYDDSDLHRLARAFVDDLGCVGGEPAIALSLDLVREMEEDRRRILTRAIWDRDALTTHHRRTFAASVDLMMIAARAELRAADVPELVEALGWCSTVRDLAEDLGRGLVNVPSEVVADARREGIDPLDHDELVTSRAGRRWLAEQRTRARWLLERTDERLAALESRSGTALLRRFSRSIRDVADRRLPRRYPAAFDPDLGEPAGFGT